MGVKIREGGRTDKERKGFIGMVEMKKMGGQEGKVTDGRREGRWSKEERTLETRVKSVGGRRGA